MQTWGYLKKELLNKILVLQNKALRIIHFKKYNDPVIPLYKKSRILPITITITKNQIMKNCLFAFDQLNQNLPKYFENFLSPVGANHELNTRSCKLSHVLTKTEKYGRLNINNTVVRDWNENIIKLKSLDINSMTKNTLKKHLKAQIFMELAGDCN